MITWLASYPKSGNTWIRMLFNAYFDNGNLEINRLTWGRGDNSPYFYQAVSPRPIDTLTREEIVYLRPAALMHLIEATGQKPMLVKTHHARASINDIPLIPDKLTKRTFYIVRDPRAVAVSYAKHMAIDIDAAIAQMRDYQWTIGNDERFFHTLSTWSRHVQTWLDCDDFPVHLVKYENLINDPAHVLRGMLERIGFEDIDDQRIIRAVEACSLSNLQAQEAKHGFEESPRDMHFFGGTDWRNVLSNEQVDQIEHDHGHVMRELGYDTGTLRNIA